MQGQFIRKKTNIVLGCVLIFCGVFLIVLFGLLFGMAELEGDAFVLIVFICFGAADIAAGLLLLFFNRHAFLTLEGSRLSARFNWFAHLDCDVSEIEFISCGIFSLTIILHGGKRYTVGNLANASDVYLAIRRLQTAAQPEEKSSRSTEELKAELDRLLTQRKRRMIAVFAGIALMFVWIISAVIVTSGKDLPDFATSDWIKFGAFIALEVITGVVLFVFAGKAGKQLVVIQQKQMELRKTVIEQYPMPAGRLIKAYTDTEYLFRVTVMGLPMSENVYYILEAMTIDYTLEKQRESEIFETIEKLEPELAVLHEI